MPFSLKDASHTFQRLLNTLFHNCHFSFIYLDDVQIFSKNKEAWRPVSHAFHSSIPLLAGPPPRITVTSWSPGQVAGGALWRPCFFTPIHSLTGPVGQPLTSRLGGQWFASRICTFTSTSETGSLLLAMSHYRGTFPAP
jgi:hypothetical protein